VCWVLFLVSFFFFFKFRAVFFFLLLVWGVPSVFVCRDAVFFLFFVAIFLVLEVRVFFSCSIVFFYSCSVVRTDVVVLFCGVWGACLCMLSFRHFLSLRGTF